MSPIVFLLAFNPLLKLAADLNQGYGYSIELPLQNSDDFPPLDSSIYVKWEELSLLDGIELESQNISKMALVKLCMMIPQRPLFLRSSIYRLPCSRRARRFVPLDSTPVTLKSKWKSSPKYYHSSEYSVKAYADDATLISNCLRTHTMVLQQMDQKATDLDLSFKPSKCVSYLFDGSQHNRQGIELSGGITKSITEGGTKFLGKSLEVSLSATKSVANKKMCNLLSNLLSTTDVLPIRGEYKLWLYRNYIISLLCFHLSVDAVTKGAVTKMENMATRYLKKWLGLPRSATRAVLYYPGMCCPSISQVSRQARLSLLSCIDASFDYQLQELGLQLHLGDAYLQTHASDYSILSEARSQLTSFPMARRLYLLSKKLIAADERSCYVQ